jgi:uncharacterized protein (DUF2384 family)
MANLTLDPAQLTVDQIRKEAEEVVLDSDRWLRTPNDQLGGREPMDLINSDREADRRVVWDLIESIKYGFFT